MGRWKVSRRGVSAALFASFVAPVGRAWAQDDGGVFDWALATAAIWIEMLKVPTDLLATSTLSTYRVARTDSELADMRARAAEKRVALETAIARCRAMVEATVAVPDLGDDWAQEIVDQVPNDQRTALDRLSALALFLESNSNNYASGAIPFTAASRMAMWAVFGETDWIMASSTKLSRLEQEPDSFPDLWFRSATLDWLSSSVIRGVLVRIVRGDPPAHIAEAQAVLTGVAAEMRRIAALFSTAGERRLGVHGEARSRVRAALPRLSALAEQQALALEAVARGWPSLTPAELLAEDSPHSVPPSLVNSAGPLLDGIGLPT